MISVFHDLESWHAYRAQKTQAGKTFGFVPTMGALHEGHAHLIKRSAQENDETLISIFVNPTQFDDPTDLDRYPRTLEADLKLASEAGATAAFVPSARLMYPDDFRYQIHENTLSTKYCGQFRPGHFNGMLTVVLKLLQIAGAERAYFGEKDWQQLQLVRGLVEAFFIPTQIIAVETVREASGLALSSRNERLSPAARERASVFPTLLKQARTPKDALEGLRAQGFDVDYVEDWESRRLAAIRIENVRLIDNVKL